jgi:hypothetical protein
MVSRYDIVFLCGLYGLKEVVKWATLVVVDVETGSVYPRKVLKKRDTHPPD